MDVHTKEQRSRNMKAIKSTGTKLELRLRKTLWHMGYRYRKNDKRVFGKPDISFKKYKVAIFIDSEFFHGKNWETAKHKIRSNKEFWYKKIEGNIQRDRKVNDRLIEDDWTVLRFLSKKIEKNLEECINEISKVIAKKKQTCPYNFTIFL